MRDALPPLAFIGFASTSLQEPGSPTRGPLVFSRSPWRLRQMLSVTWGRLTTFAGTRPEGSRECSSASRVGLLPGYV